ncbi:MAG: CBS domain-containing protein [Alphaproteobacteria bacterium]|nr:CBS domain-containing protein [Alphaproteobacteria bacterium]
MTCRSIMNVNPPKLLCSSTVAEALGLLRWENRMNLPVVDAKGQYAGLFGAHQILMLALPKGACIDDKQGFAYVTDTQKDITNRLQGVAHHPVERYMDSESPPLHPDMPLVETMLTLYRRHEDLPVIDPETRQLLGIVTIRSSLGKLMVQS